MRQERFSPSTDVSGWKGRQDYLKGYPGAAMSDALNGGFAGGGARDYTLTDSYEKFYWSNYNYGMLNVSGIPQTHKHLYIECTLGSQSTYWMGIPAMTLLPNTGFGSSGLPTSLGWSSGQYFYRGWSTGNGANNMTNVNSGLTPLTPHYSNNSCFQTMKIYNYTESEKLKPYTITSRYNTGNNSSYAVWLEASGYFMQASNTASPPITSIVSYDPYQNGETSYQAVAIYGFGGKV